MMMKKNKNKKNKKKKVRLNSWQQTLKLVEATYFFLSQHFSPLPFLHPQLPRDHGCQTYITEQRGAKTDAHLNACGALSMVISAPCPPMLCPHRLRLPETLKFFGVKE